MRIDWLMMVLVAVWITYAWLLLTFGRGYLRRLARARRQLVATRHVRAADELPQAAAENQDVSPEPEAA